MSKLNAVRPIQTSYNGRLFRSRLEARWAVFYDALGVRWDYEPEGYHLPSGWYLPDFYFPDFGFWVEIKPKAATDEEIRLADELADSLRQSVYVFDGGIFPPRDKVAPSAIARVYPPGITRGYRSDSEMWCECPHCGEIRIESWGWTLLMKCCDQSRKDFDEGPNRGDAPDSPRIMAAFTAALSARFEHGESPKRR